MVLKISKTTSKMQIILKKTSTEILMISKALIKWNKIKQAKNIIT